ncbi:general odorant-binding protein 19d-like isoform X1 [Culex pipiens pallens]|uniref:general odorant-binding protein 19d-like isoform X1 n=1 Tax=Culex pipiens pallens TaxID=42434 RepID=UPI0022AAB864|nr:general odorant-binding protein 19d-like isoform X1 [Culex pipiens pallens]
MCRLQVVIVVLVLVVQVYSQVGPFKEILLAVRRGMLQDCKESLGATDADVEHIINANEPENQVQKCLAHCAMKQFGILHGRKFNKQGFASVAKLVIFLDKRKSRYVDQVADECDKIDNEDLCELGAELYMCAVTGLRKRGIQL